MINPDNSQVITLAASINVTYAIHLGLGSHLWTIQRSNLERVLRCQASASELMFFAVVFGRVSLGLYLFRFSRRFQAHRIFLIVLLVLIIGVGVIEVSVSSATLALCLPSGRDFAISKHCTVSFTTGYRNFTLFVGGKEYSFWTGSTNTTSVQYNN